MLGELEPEKLEIFLHGIFVSPSLRLSFPVLYRFYLGGGAYEDKEANHLKNNVQ